MENGDGRAYAAAAGCDHTAIDPSWRALLATGRATRPL
jgi:hypothetical protein